MNERKSMPPRWLLARELLRRLPLPPPFPPFLEENDGAAETVGDDGAGETDGASLSLPFFPFLPFLPFFPTVGARLRLGSTLGEVEGSKDGAIDVVGSTEGVRDGKALGPADNDGSTEGEKLGNSVGWDGAKDGKTEGASDFFPFLPLFPPLPLPLMERELVKTGD